MPSGEGADPAVATACPSIHEFNALGFHTPDGKGGYLRPHTEKNCDQHVATLAYPRIGGADYDRVTGNAISARCIHRTTGPVSGRVDPHHTGIAHALLFNATYDETEGRWKAAQLGNVISNKGFYQAPAAQLKKSSLSCSTYDYFGQQFSAIISLYLPDP